jgi:hypothetical protein
MDIGLSKKGIYLLRPPITYQLFEGLKDIAYKPISDPGRLSDREKLNPIVLPFYLFIILYLRLPTPEEFYKQYKLCYQRDVYKLGSVSDATEEVIKARLYRAYPSLIRDIHFYTLCSSDPRFDEVKYSTEVDKQGVDLIVSRGGKRFAVRLHNNSEAANNWAKTKEVAGSFSAVIDIVLDNPNKIGDFNLYTEQSLDYLAAAMDVA